MRLKSFDNYLIAMMGLLALISLYMLYGIKYFTSKTENQMKIASIVEQIKTVKRKRDFYQSWVDVNPGDGLSQNDEIYTHEQSSAKIYFEKGPEINLFENSLLRIKTLNKENILNLERGNLTARLSKDSPKLDVVLNGKKYSFESQNANIQIEQGAIENKFLLLEGRAKLNINQTSQEIGANQVIIQNKSTGSLKIKELPFILKNPLHNSVSYFSKDIEMDFSWSYTSLRGPAQILIAKDSDFKDIVVHETISEDHFRSLFDKAGIYYWKLVSTDELEGGIRSFAIVEEQPLALNLDKNIIYKAPKLAEKILISWPQDKAKKFLLKIERPNKNVDEIEVAQNNYELPIDETGSYHISVKVNDENRPQAIWSHPSPLEVIEAQAINITSNTAELIEKVNYNQESTSLLLSWNAPSSGVNYIVKLIKDNKKQEIQTQNTSLPIALTEAGDYQWEIEGKTPSGIVTNVIKGRVIVKAPLRLIQTPSEGAVIELEKPDQLVSFKWDHIQNTKDYQFELSNDQAFSKIIYERSIETNSHSTTVAQTGRYFWRVKIQKATSVEYSSPVGVEIKPTPPLKRPEVSPNIKIKLKYLDDKTSTFHWSDFFIGKAHAEAPVAVAEWDLPANNRAKEYIVEIYQDEQLSHLIARIETSVPHVVWKNATPGNFYWRVSYVDYWGRKTQFSELSILSTEFDQETIKVEAIKEAAKEVIIGPIELLHPLHKEDILANEEDEFVFTWASLPNTKSYQFILASDLDFKDPLINSKTRINEIKIKCLDLKNIAANYYWKVTTPEGNTSKRRVFHISCTPKKIEPPAVTEHPLINLNIKEERKILHYAKLGVFPHKLNYTNTSGQYSAKVSGNALTSLFALYHRPLNLKYFQSLTPSIWMSRGKVFNTITFNDFEFNIKAAKNQSYFSWGPMVAMIKKTTYIESNRVITAQSISTPLLGAFLQKEVGRFTLDAEVKFGGMLDYHLGLQYALKNNISTGVFFDSTSVNKDASKHDFSRLGLNLNYMFSFLDNKK